MSTTHVAVCLLGILFCAAPARAQNLDIEKLFYQLEEAGGDGGTQAAHTLFTQRSPSIDDRLRRIMRSPKTKPASRECVLGAIKLAGLTRPKLACDLGREALGDPKAELTRTAIKTLSALNKPAFYKAVEEALASPELRWPSPKSRAMRQALGLVAVLEHLPHPLWAIRVLIKVYNQRGPQELESALQATLERRTACRFDDPDSWKDWWEKTIEKDKPSLSEWEVEVNQRIAKRFKELEQTTEDFYGRLLASQQGKPEQLLASLEIGLAQENVLAVCKRAIYELGRLGHIDNKGPERARAVRLLRTRLGKSDKSSGYDEIRAAVILALGQTKDSALLEDLLGFLDHSSPRMRAVTATALASLKAEAAISVLVAQLRQKDADLVKASIDALGSIGKNAELRKGVRVADELIGLGEELKGANGAAGPAVGEILELIPRALGRLEYADADRKRVIKVLAQLAEDESYVNVRFEAITALGPMLDAGVFETLRTRLAAEKEPHIRKSILDAIGMQAVSDPKRIGLAVEALVPFLFVTGDENEALRRISFQRLEEISRGADLLGLETVVTTLTKTRDEAEALRSALPFLRQLPAEGSDELSKASKPVKERCHHLLEVRARAQTEIAPQQALEDYRRVMQFFDLRRLTSLSSKTMPTFLGRARALLRAPSKKPLEAFQIAEASIKKLIEEKAKQPALNALAWEVALEALAQAKRSVPKETPKLIQALDKLIATAPPQASKRLDELRK